MIGASIMHTYARPTRIGCLFLENPCRVCSVDSDSLGMCLVDSGSMW
jgi:hypothetical protein